MFLLTSRSGTGKSVATRTRSFFEEHAYNPFTFALYSTAPAGIRVEANCYPVDELYLHFVKKNSSIAVR